MSSQLVAALLSADDGDGEREISPAASAAAVNVLRWYKRNVSPLMPPGCRFIPTCSEYAVQSFERYTIPQAVVLTAWRLVRCNPIHWPKTGYGVDEPQWPPPAYWAGSSRLRTFVDDDESRARALASLDDGGNGGDDGDGGGGGDGDSNRDGANVGQRPWPGADSLTDEAQAQTGPSRRVHDDP